MKLIFASLARVSSLAEALLASIGIGLASGAAVWNFTFRGDSLATGVGGRLKVNLLTNSLARSTADFGEADLGGEDTEERRGGLKDGEEVLRRFAGDSTFGGDGCGELVGDGSASCSTGRYRC